MVDLDAIRKRNEWCMGSGDRPYTNLARPDSDQLPNGFCSACRSDKDAYLDRHDLIKEVERLEEQNDESWLQGRKEGHTEGLNSAIKYIRERSGRMFADRRDDEAKFLRSLVDEMEKL